MGYSQPINKWVTLDELKEYLYTQDDQPDVIPYVTSYYKERVGFCISRNKKDELEPGEYHMVVDSESIDGSMTYGECIIPGDTEKTILFSAYICHPSMANDNCSGLALQSELINYVAQMQQRKYTYKFIFAPETIGAIAYINKNYEDLKQNMIAGFNLTCVGDDKGYSMIGSPYADTLADRILDNVLSSRSNYTYYSFLSRGSDERQYCSPGVELPYVDFSRSMFGHFPEYHTSLDDMNFVSVQGFEGSYQVMTEVIQALENNSYFTLKVRCEPQLGKRGLYPTVSKKGSYDEVQTLIDFLAYANGREDLVDVSNRIKKPIVQLIPIVKKLKKENLLTESDTNRMED